MISCHNDLPLLLVYCPKVKASSDAKTAATAHLEASDFQLVDDWRGSFKADGGICQSEPSKEKLFAAFD